jgi:trigger factor
MNIVRTDIDSVNATLTLHIEKADYAENVEKKLREYRKKANVPGFRPGMTPVGLLKKLYGKSIIAEEINKLISENLYKYIHDNNIELLGEPLPNESEQPEFDFDVDEGFDFLFDISLAPAFDVEISSKDKVKYYEIETSNEMIDNRVKNYTARYGKYVQEDIAEPKDMLKGELVELENGEPKADGIKISDAVLTPEYINDEEQKALLAGAAKGAEIVFNPSKAYKDETEIASLLKVKKEDIKGLTSDFKFTIDGITRYVEAEINQELFDKIYGDGVVNNEEEFREKIKESVKTQLVADSDYKFAIDVRETLLAKYNDLIFPETFLKRWLLANNKELTPEKADEDYPKMIEDLKWQLITSKLLKTNDIKIVQEDIDDYAKTVARAQFAQYGMYDTPDEYIEKFAEDMLKKEETLNNIINRIGENKVTELLKTQVKLDKKTISIEDFNKLFENK